MNDSGSHRGLYIGAISGTSVDGLDLALLDCGDRIELLAATTCQFPHKLREQLLGLGQPGADDLDQLGQTDRKLGEFIGQAIAEFLRDEKIDSKAIIAIGSHGQTVRHRPDLADAFTWQIGDPNMISEITGITTVADFRRRDMAAQGQGAPLVPPFHAAVFGTEAESRVIVNIGGISNITALEAARSEPVSGFDTGPGNALMDSWCMQHRGSPFDEDGHWAMTGKVNEKLLQALLSDPYFARPPPKSTGREMFNLAWLNKHLSAQARSGNYPESAQQCADVQRTLAELSAVSLSNAIGRWVSACDRLIICGGGRLNPLLMRRLRELNTVDVDLSEDHGFDGDALEAAAFGWMARQRLAGESANAPAVTGAQGKRVLGAVYHA